MTDFTRRVKMRALMEDRDIDHDREIGSEWDLAEVSETTDSVVGRVFRAEAEHPTNLFAQTAIVRKDACDTTGPDLEAFAAAFATALQQHDEEYL